MFSAAGCVNAEIGSFYLPAEMQPSAADARQKCSNVNEPLYVPSQSVLLSTYADVKSII